MFFQVSIVLLGISNVFGSKGKYIHAMEEAHTRSY